MRNLKRVLSLALALVMVLGMMVITTSAAKFDDAEEITNTEAVDVISAIGVITGDNGSFYPNRALTREEGAALICYLLMGKNKADKLVGSGNFADVASDRWSAGEIDYCANLGIILGYTDADGKQVFNPKGELTAVAYGRMLLGALGYDGGIEGYTGTNWASSITADMIEVGLEVKGVDMDAVLTREQAAQMTLQALTKTMVKYEDKGSSIIIGGVEISTGASEAEAKTWGTSETKYDYKGGTDYASVEFCEKYFKDLQKVGAADDDFGRPNSHKWTYKINGKTATVCTVAETADEVVVIKKNGTTMASILKDLELEAESGVTGTFNIGTVVELFNTDNDAKIDDYAYTTQTLSKITKVVAATGENVKYDNAVSFGTVTGANSAVARSYTDDKLTGFDAATMVKDTYVLTVRGTNTAVVSVPDVVTGKMTAKGDGYVKIDGEKYEYAYGVTPISSYTNTYDVYLNDNGYVVGYTVAQEAKEETQIFYIKGNEGKELSDFSAASVKLAVVALDGAESIVEMNVYAGSGNAKDDVKVNNAPVAITNGTISGIPAGFYAYTLTDDGKIGSITMVADSDDVGFNAKKGVAQLNTGNAVFETKSAVVTIDGDTYYATSDTKVVTLKGGKATTVTGYANFVGTTTYTNGYYTFSGTTLKEIYVYNANAMAAASDEVYGWFIEKGDTYEKKVNGSDTAVTDVVYFVKGEPVTYTVEAIYADGADSDDTVVAGLSTIVVGTDGLVDLVSKTSNEANKIVVAEEVEAVYADYIVIDTDPVALANDVKYYDVTNIKKNGVVELDGLNENDIVTYTLKAIGGGAYAIDTVYVTYFAQEDGALTVYNSTYLTEVANFAYDNADTQARFAAGQVSLTQYTATTNASGMRYVMAHETNPEWTSDQSWDTYPRVAGEKYIMTTNWDYVDWGEGNYTYTIYGSDGELYSTGTIYYGG